MSIKLEQFGGIAPKISAALLPGNMATIAKNLRVDSGALVPLKGTTQIATVPSTSKSIYRHETSPGVWEWLYWDAQDVNVVRNPIANDIYNRIYYTGDGAPKYGFTDTESLVFSKGLLLGVPRPSYPPILSTSAAAGAPTSGTVASAIEFTAGPLTLTGSATLGANSVTKTTDATNGQWDKQGYSVQSYKSACALRFTLPVRAYGAIAGLDGDPSTKATMASIDFGILSDNKGVISIYEAGKVKGSYGTHADTDVFEIEYRGAQILYKKNGDVLRESKTLIEREFYFDSSLAGQGSAVENIEFGAYSVPDVDPVFKAGGVTLNGNADITGNRAEKTKGAAAWNRQAYTLENYTDGCLVKFQFGSTKGAAGGLNGPPLTASGYGNIDYAIVGNESGNIKIYESGVDRGAFGTYAAGDRFEVEYAGTSVIYRKNGIVMRTVATTAGRTFYFDSSLRAKGSIIQAIEFGTILKDEAIVEAFVEEATEKERYYVFTYVTPLGEEGPPSPPALIKVNDLQDVALAFVGEPLSGYNLGAGARRRVYRTAQGTTDTTYLYVGEAPIEDLTMQDNLLDVSLGEILPSTTWFPPPADLAGIMVTPNGFLVGFSGNAVCASEIGFPHAFNPLNQLSFSKPITGMAITGDSIIVLTEDAPYLVTGQRPEELSAVLIDHPQTCANRASIVNMGGYVMMASPDGLLSVTANDMAVASQQFFTRDQWQAYSPSTMRGFFYEGIYIGFSDTQAFMFDMRDEQTVLTELEGFNFIAGYRDNQSDTLFLLDANGNIKSWETGSPSSMTWKSKPQRVPVPMCPAAIRVFASGPVTFNLWADGINVVTNMLISGNSAARLPAGYKAIEFQLQITGSSSVDSVTIANSMKELA
ncbi:hypothetical protein [Methylomicrobium agile]|uniref:hypothetical protein n=1 Tax=Methylomicrobium agile TaxID=39774 RepID=UPI0004DF1ADE|nr:hypothetical protein [Methylomicrobium agile]